MKALRDFLVAGPCDYDRKWAEYIALVPDLAGFLNPKCDPAEVSSASSITHSTAPLRVLSNAVPTDSFQVPAATTFSSTSALAISTSAAASVLAETSGRVPANAPVDSPSSSVPAAPYINPAASVSPTAVKIHTVSNTPVPCLPVCVGGAIISPSTASTPTATSVAAAAVFPNTNFAVMPVKNLEAEAAAIYDVLRADASVFEQRLAGYTEKYCSGSSTTLKSNFITDAPTICSTVCLGGDTNFLSITTTPAAAPTSSVSHPDASRTAPAVGVLGPVSCPPTAPALASSPSTPAVSAMEHQSLLIKAMSEFALADPEDSDREWAAYLAQVQSKDAASSSSLLCVPTSALASILSTATPIVSPAYMPRADETVLPCETTESSKQWQVTMPPHPLDPLIVSPDDAFHELSALVTNPVPATTELTAMEFSVPTSEFHSILSTHPGYVFHGSIAAICPPAFSDHCQKQLLVQGIDVSWSYSRVLQSGTVHFCYQQLQHNQPWSFHIVRVDGLFSYGIPDGAPFLWAIAWSLDNFSVCSSRSRYCILAAGFTPFNCVFCSARGDYFSWAVAWLFNDTFMLFDFRYKCDLSQWGSMVQQLAMPHGSPLCKWIYVGNEFSAHETPLHQFCQSSALLVLLVPEVLLMLNLLMTEDNPYLGSETFEWQIAWFLLGPCQSSSCTPGCGSYIFVHTLPGLARTDWVLSNIAGSPTPYGSELVQWEIAWSLPYTCLYGSETVQWQIAWSLYFGCSMPGYHSLHHGSLLCQWIPVGMSHIAPSILSIHIFLLLPWHPDGLTTAWDFSCPCTIDGNGFVRIQMPCNAQACKYTVLVLQCHCCIFLRRHYACEPGMTTSKMAETEFHWSRCICKLSLGHLTEVRPMLLMKPPLRSVHLFDHVDCIHQSAWSVYYQRSGDCTSQQVDPRPDLPSREPYILAMDGIKLPCNCYNCIFWHRAAIFSNQGAMKLPWDPGAIAALLANSLCDTTGPKARLSSPWDPGGFWLEGKPNFKVEGLSTYPSCLTWWAITYGWVPYVSCRRQGAESTNTCEQSARNGGEGLEASAWTGLG